MNIGESGPGDRHLDERLLEEVRTRALAQSGRITGADVAEAVRASGLVVGSGSTARVVRILQEELTGLGPLQRYAERPGVTDVLVDGDGAVWLDGPEGLDRAEYRFPDAEAVRRLAVRLVAAGGRRLDEAEPCGDVVVGPYRVHAVLPPVATGGPVISVRVRAPNTVHLEGLLGRDSPWLPLLRSIVSARTNFLVSGGTGSGKTTLLSAMLAAAPHGERLIIVEDSHELAPDHPHVVNLQCRAGNVEGAGAVTLDELVRQSLRMRPDRLVVGECRGAELRDFLAAMNTGHDGAGGTLHASSPGAVPARLVAMGALAGLGPEATALQAASAVDFVVHMRRPRSTERPAATGGPAADRAAAGRTTPAASRRGPEALAAIELQGGALTAVPLARTGADGRLELSAEAPRLLGPLLEHGLPTEVLRVERADEPSEAPAGERAVPRHRFKPVRDAA
ncbi:TadA family conjugal transfer-associated ATPase [Zhihengliuella sp.]|uniref:TadA family conjugal transfer-associated ATPase n=1 Tax=Zhihengliuella sp. TaxID=1954483 RepID=UPI0028113B01|nr:TadA family conjugal transfer-associated ATPase [Zhihengliuella sp.]